MDGDKGTGRKRKMKTQGREEEGGRGEGRKRTPRFALIVSYLPLPVYDVLEVVGLVVGELHGSDEPALLLSKVMSVSRPLKQKPQRKREGNRNGSALWFEFGSRR